MCIKKEEVFKHFLLLVPRPGVEPGWMLLHWCLRPARLPIPPSGQLFFSIAVQRYAIRFKHATLLAEK